MALPGGLTLPENEGTIDELLTDQLTPDALLRSEQWQHFTRQAHKVNKCHHAAHCNACTKKGEATGARLADPDTMRRADDVDAFEAALQEEVRWLRDRDAAGRCRNGNNTLSDCRQID